MIQESGVLLVGISMGEPKHIRRYCDKLAPSVLCLVGEDGTPYRAYGLEDASAGSMFSLEVAKGIVRAIGKGHVGGQPVGDVKMMPGSFLVDTEGRVRFAHYNQHIGDHADLNEMLSALR